MKFRDPVTVGATKKFLVLFLVLLILLTGLPVMMVVHSMDTCASCPGSDALVVFGMCFAVLAAAMIALRLSIVRIGARRCGIRILLLVRTLERPPRLA